MSFDTILREAEALSPDEKAELIRRLEEQLAAAGRGNDLTDPMKTELDRRIAVMDGNPGLGIPWDVVKAESLKRART